MATPVEDFQTALLTQRVVERYAVKTATDAEGGKAYDAGQEWLKTKGRSKVNSLIRGMHDAAKKDGAKQFGTRDVKEALSDWFEGGQAYENSKQKAALKFLATPEGKKVVKALTDGLEKSMRGHGQLGFRDITKVLREYF